MAFECVFFKSFLRQILFSRTFQDSPVYSSTFQACANPVDLPPTVVQKGKSTKYRGPAIW